MENLEISEVENEEFTSFRINITEVGCDFALLELPRPNTKIVEVYRDELKVRFYIKVFKC